MGPDTELDRDTGPPVLLLVTIIMEVSRDQGPSAEVSRDQDPSAGVNMGDKIMILTLRHHHHHHHPDHHHRRPMTLERTVMMRITDTIVVMSHHPGDLAGGLRIGGDQTVMEAGGGEVRHHETQ